MLSHLKCTSRCLKVTGSVHLVHRGLAEQTHYEVLQIPRTATPDQIKAAYIRKCKQVHPDRNRLTSESNVKFIRLNEAYNVLSKPNEKREYDRKLNMGINVTESYDYSPPRPPGPKPDDRIYKNYQQSYYGATQEERAQKERDFYRRQQRKQEKAEMGWAPDTQTNQFLFNALIVSVIVGVGLIANTWLKRSAEKERAYWRRRYGINAEAVSKEENTKEKKTGITRSLAIVLVASALYFAFVFWWTNRTMRERAVKAREAMESANGSKYTRAKRKYLRTDFELRMEEMERRRGR